MAMLRRQWPGTPLDSHPGWKSPMIALLEARNLAPPACTFSSHLLVKYYAFLFKFWIQIHGRDCVRLPWRKLDACIYLHKCDDDLALFLGARASRGRHKTYQGRRAQHLAHVVRCGLHGYKNVPAPASRQLQAIYCIRCSIIADIQAHATRRPGVNSSWRDNPRRLRVCVCVCGNVYLRAHVLLTAFPDPSSLLRCWAVFFFSVLLRRVKNIPLSSQSLLCHHHLHVL
jgi:hypothetical protein